MVGCRNVIGFFYIKNSEVERMYFKNERHRQAFRDGMKKTNRKDRESVSAVYLLSAEPCLRKLYDIFSTDF